MGDFNENSMDEGTDHELHLGRGLKRTTRKHGEYDRICSLWGMTGLQKPLLS